MNAEQVETDQITQIEIVDEIGPIKTEHGLKQEGTVKYTKGLIEESKTMRFNQTFINWLIRESKTDESKEWIGLKPLIKTKVIMGHNAIVPKSTQ